MVPELIGYIYNNPKTIYFGGKFEQLLDLQNIADERLHEPEVWPSIARDMAHIHLITQQDIPLTWKYNVTTWPWNTRFSYIIKGQRWKFFESSKSFEIVRPNRFLFEIEFMAKN